MSYSQKLQKKNSTLRHNKALQSDKPATRFGLPLMRGVMIFLSD